MNLDYFWSEQASRLGMVLDKIDWLGQESILKNRRKKTKQKEKVIRLSIILFPLESLSDFRDTIKHFRLSLRFIKTLEAH